MDAEKHTRETIRAMNGEDYTRLRDAYFKMAEGLGALADEASSLGTDEREALQDLRAAMSKLNHLGGIL
jgi:hypothetical protein